MKNRSWLATLLVLALVAVGTIRASDESESGSPVSTVAKAEKPKVQIALLLDTSGSMDGLISQAKSQLWKMVNEFIGAKRGGVSTEVQVGLYEYGKDSLLADEGYLRMILPLTTDLDKVSEELFALKTNGGQEYCGRVIKAAVEGLTWSKDNADFKVIIIAGNEPFTQGNVLYSDACTAAVAKGIIVNTIHCGDFQLGVSQKWQDGATLSGGKYMNIDQNRTAVNIEAPQDKELAKLGVDINKTYIAFGAAGNDGLKRQMAQDKNAEAASPSSLADRAAAKGSALYSNELWDLVDACKKDSVKLADVKEEQLPEEMRKMTLDQRKAHLTEKETERTKIQAEITRLNTERNKFLADEMKKRATAGEKTLDEALIKAVREQCKQKKFEF
jgi:hypothetical protein